MFQWESCISLGVLLILLVLLALQLLLGLLLLQPLLLQVLQPSLLLSGVLLMLCLDQCLQKFINKTLQGGKRLLFNSDPWPPAEQKLEMPCDNNYRKMLKDLNKNILKKNTTAFWSQWGIGNVFNGRKTVR